MMDGSSQLSTAIRNCAEQLATEGVAAMGGLFDLTAQRLVRYATAVSGNQHDAEDAVQSALTKAATQPQRLLSAKAPWPYLLRMVRNEVLQSARKRRRLAFLPDLRDLLTRCAVDELEQEETHRAIWSALRRLPSEQVEVVVLKIWEEMTFAQIGELLDLSPDTAASRYRYAMRRLTRMLAAKQAEVV